MYIRNKIVLICLIGFSLKDSVLCLIGSRHLDKIIKSIAIINDCVRACACKVRNEHSSAAGHNFYFYFKIIIRKLLIQDFLSRFLYKYIQRSSFRKEFFRHTFKLFYINYMLPKFSSNILLTRMLKNGKNACLGNIISIL